MRRILVAGAALALLAAGCGEPPPERGAPVDPGSPAASASAGPPVITVTATVRDGKVRTARSRVRVPRGATVEITVTSDRADEFHLHGYDREMELAAGRPATMRFTAGTPGVFEAELHHSGGRVFELQVG